MLYFFIVLAVNLGGSSVYHIDKIPLQSSNAEKVDSLFFHKIEFLEQIIQSSSSYTLDENSNIDSLLEVSIRQSQTIGFFVELTSIEPKKVYMYASDYVLDTLTIRRWKEWIRMNRGKLYYDHDSGKLISTALKP